VNSIEKQMVEVLTECKSHGALSVKAEFEAEGTRMDELLRLVDVARAAGLQVTVKIGGCEAIRDLLEAKQVGVDYIVAPMVETPYALSKFLGAISIAFDDDERENTDFLFNLETITAYKNIEEMIDVASKGGLEGIVFGRVDFSGSLGLGREGIETDEITNRVIETAKRAKPAGLDLVVGGAISSGALPQLRRINHEYLTRFETRKVVFGASSLDDKNIENGLLLAVHFELLWLINKRNYYAKITSEDHKRIELLDARWKILNKKGYDF
jgi:methylmalonyl-CoA mutase cobalamin-binding subunit